VFNVRAWQFPCALTVSEQSNCSVGLGCMLSFSQVFTITAIVLMEIHDLYLKKQVMRVLQWWCLRRRNQSYGQRKFHLDLTVSVLRLAQRQGPRSSASCRLSSNPANQKRRPAHHERHDSGTAGYVQVTQESLEPRTRLWPSRVVSEITC